ncbi:hypothetical protein ABZW38_31520 [Streptomyces bacillaris]
MVQNEDERRPSIEQSLAGVGAVNAEGPGKTDVSPGPGRASQ